MKKTAILLVCIAFSLTAFAQQNNAPRTNATALLQQALSAVAGIQADVNMLKDDTARLNLRIEELERQVAERDQKIARLESLCATQTTQMQNLEKQWNDRLAALSNTLEKDRQELQRKFQQLNKDLTSELAKAAAPAPAAAAKPAYTGKLQEFKVESGDTVGSIAKAAGCTVKEIVELNNLRSADSIRVGQILKVPVK